MHFSGYYFFTASTTTSLDYSSYNPLENYAQLERLLEAELQQRYTWHVPRKTSIRPPVPPARRYQKSFKGHLFPPGAKK